MYKLESIPFVMSHHVRCQVPLDAKVTPVHCPVRGYSLQALARVGGPRYTGNFLLIAAGEEVSPEVGDGLELVGTVPESNRLARYDRPVHMFQYHGPLTCAELRERSLLKRASQLSLEWRTGVPGSDDLIVLQRDSLVIGAWRYRDGAVQAWPPKKGQKPILGTVGERFHELREEDGISLAEWAPGDEILDFGNSEAYGRVRTAKRSRILA